MLCTWTRDTYGIDFLKTICTDERKWYLSRDNNHWDRIHICSCQSSDGIGKARSRCNHCHAYFACRSCISICCMHRCLFVTVQDMLEPLLLIYFIINVHDSPARVTKYCSYTFSDNRFTYHLCTRHLSHYTLHCYILSDYSEIRLDLFITHLQSHTFT